MELFKYIKKNKLAYLSLYLIGIFYFLAIFADFIAPYPYDIQHRDTPYHPPTQIHFFDEKGNFHLRPFVYKYELVDPISKSYKINYDVKHPIYFFTHGHTHYLLGFIKTDLHLFGVKEGKIFYLVLIILGETYFQECFMHQGFHYLLDLLEFFFHF
jgi:hypothetical protein